ncbi:MAG: GNAT family protein [Oscillospiraceae bacterium]|nr:GNAT family protein [Oscillospiraceae bacterium]
MESVINEIDRELWSANFRIALFHPGQRGRRIDFWAVEGTRDYAFRELKLHRLSPDVLSFNPRAQKFCKKAGFRVEGVLRDSVMDGDVYGDDILMALLEDKWRARTGMNLTAGLRTPAARISRL